MTQKHKWFKTNNLKCVVLVAGKGSRLLTLTEDNPKPMVNVVEKPILNHVINYWKEYTNDFIFVVNYKKEKIIDYVQGFKDINHKFVVQNKLKGIANALLSVENIVGDRFIVVLGDCICKGDFSFPHDMVQGVGIWETNNINDIKNSYTVKLKGNLVDKVREKPKKVYNNLCGLGFYFFDRRIFNYIRKTSPSKLKGQIELTDVIQNMIKGKEKVSSIMLKGDYVNINTEDELNRAKEIVKT